MAWLRNLAGKLQGKGRSLARPFALRAQRAAHFLGRQSPAMQSEAVAFLLGGESMAENPCEVFSRNPDTVVNQSNADAVAATAGDAYGQPLVWRIDFIAGVFGVANQVDEY